MSLADSKYRAFISYSHRDEKWAAWLHSALETYRIPKSLVGSETSFGIVPARLAPVFRDRDELASATDLGRVLTQALRDSAYQIVICSPAAARSRWVNEEVLTFKRMGRSDRVLCLIVGGEPNSPNPAEESFPQAVRFKLGPDGRLSDEPAEPIAADVRPGKDGKANAHQKLVAGMLGIGLDALKQREQARRQRRLMALAAAGFAGMTVTSVLAATAWLARIEAEEQRVRAEAEAETARQTTDFMVELFQVSDPSESLGNSITAREILDKGAARIETELVDRPEIQATLMDTMGTVYKSLGLYTPAMSLLERSLQTRTTLLGGNQADVATSLNHLGEVLTLRADYAGAEQRLRDALDIRRRELPKPSPLVADTLADLGDLLTLQGRYADATPVIDEALGIRRELYGDADNAAVAESLQDRAFNRYHLGDLEHAIEEMRAALAMRRAVHPTVHPDLAEAVNNLALLLYENGDYVAAEPLYEEALDMVRKLLGPEHKDIAMALINVGQVLHDQQNYDAAEANYREALAMQKRLLGESHPDLVLTMNNLAFLLYDEGRVPEAIAMLDDTLALARKVLGESHPDVAAIATNLGYWLTQKGDYAQALTLIDSALAIRRAVFGDDHPLVASTLSIKANLLLATRAFADARDTARRARTILAKNFSADHWRTATAASAEGAALVELGDYTEAEPLLVHSTEILSRGGGALELESRQSQQRLDHLLHGLAKKITHSFTSRGRQMFPVPRVVRFVTPLLLASSLFVSGAASAQVSQQTLKDVWVASSTSLYQAKFDDNAGTQADERGVFLQNAGDVSRSFEAVAFELPSFDTSSGSSTPFRNLVAIDDSRLVRFENGSNETPPKLLFDAGGSPSNLKSVNTVAVTPAGTLLISGYSKSKKVFELWEVTKLPVDNANQQVVLRATGTPQLTDSVFVSDGIVAGSSLGNGGLLAAAGKQVLFFPVPANWNPANTTAKLSYQVLAETRDLPVKSNAVLTSAELVRGTDVLMIATSERTLLTRPVPGGAVTKFATLPSTANGVSCTNLRTQRVLVRSARSGEQKASVVSDICGEVLRYSFTNPSAASTAPDVLLQSGLLAIAVGEGNQIVCPVNDPNPCMLTTGFEAEIQSSFDSELLVLQFNNLCDPRVSGSACPATTQVLPGNVLNFNSALPAAIQARIQNVTIKIPPYMYGAGAGGKFGALLVRADAFTATSKAAVDLAISELIGFELGVRNDFPRLTPMDQLLHQDVAAYAPDTSDYLTVRGAEATPIVTGVGSLGGSLRGWSAVIYGLRYDFNAGNSPQSDAGRGARCDLRSGSQQFTASPDQNKFFANLSACLFDDEEDLLTSVIPNAAFAVPSNRNALLADLALVEDKLLKALQSTQPSLGSQTFNALITQLDHFDAAVAATSFNQGYVIYKNELQARSAAFRFNVIYRTVPSMPLGGF